MAYNQPELDLDNFYGAGRPVDDAGRSINVMIKGHVGEELQMIVLRRRLAGPLVLSQCNDLERLGSPTSIRPAQEGRADTFRYHLLPSHTEHFPIDNHYNLERDYFRNMCPDIARRFTIYGKIGRGTFGRIYAAREINRPAAATGFRFSTGCDWDSYEYQRASMAALIEPSDPRARAYAPKPPRQFAIKMELQCPLSIHGFTRAQTCEYREVYTGEQRFLPVEAVVLELLTECERFPKIDSVYIHKEFASIVMSANSLDDNPLRETLLLEPGTIPTQHFPGYNGEQLTHLKQTRVTEIQACKIASNILEALVYLMDMKMLHGDLSHRNYLVDKNLNTQLIDFGAVYVSENNGWEAERYGYIEAFEYFVNPEIALQLATDDLQNPIHTIADRHIPLSHDRRVQYLWKFGVLVYDLLHGYSPWETPEPQANNGDIKTLYAWDDYDEEKFLYLYDRRLRIMNEELPIDERLSQDCVDALRHLLARDVSDRMDMAELQRLPWFQGQWVDRASEMQRPPRKEP